MDGVIRGRPRVAGEATGDVLGSDEPLSFWGGYDAATGEIIDRRHPLLGQNASGRVLAIPATRGSSTTAAVFLEALRQGTAPVAILTSGPDRFLALAAIVAEEMGGESIPIIALEAGDFERIWRSRAVSITTNGSVTPLDGAAPPAS